MQTMPQSAIRKLTPVIMVDAIEPCVPFLERVGFAKTAEVPEGDRLGFVILAKDGVEVMYQTRASVIAAARPFGPEPTTIASYSIGMFTNALLSF